MNEFLKFGEKKREKRKHSVKLRICKKCKGKTGFREMERVIKKGEKKDEEFEESE